MPANHHIIVTDRRIELLLPGFIDKRTLGNILTNNIGNIRWHSASFQQHLTVEC